MHALQLIAGIVAAYFALVAVLMEFSIKRPRSDSGKLRVKADGLVVRNLYGCNFFREANALSCPNTLCSLYWGIFSGSLLSVMIVFVMAVIQAIGFLLGWMPIFSRGTKEPFRNYQRYGDSNEGRWIAPWKFIIALLLVAFAGDIAKGLVALHWRPILHECLVAAAFLAGLVSIFALVFVLLSLKDKAEEMATSELVLAIKKRFCPLVEPVYKDGRQA